ncbi:MAG: FAD-dependent oxidoreductase [Chitinophagaceae bacterium]|nr:MAG: FAD-dependent oxidoreductase [Chitinophagaceae bacterium]
MDRRSFIQASLTFTGVSALLASCKPRKKVKGKIVGASSNVGHLLRDKKFDQPTSVQKKEVVIVGGGVSGLSAAYHLQKGGIHDFVLLDLEANVGGNAACGKNDFSAYPWGAHYVPIPNNDLKEYLKFLKEANVVVGENEKGLPIYNELFLCFDPEERLYINGQWQEGLVPQFGVPPEERIQIDRFLSVMNEFRYKKGNDGKDAFALPVDESSKDEAFTILDSITTKTWLIQQGFTSPYLHWYVNYCTRDDFGTPYDKASAWAGIHYFACRKGNGANAQHQDVLTWPEGNGWLVAQLEKTIRSSIQTNCLVIKVEQAAGKVVVSYLDIKSNSLKAVEAEECIIAVPQFIAGRLLNDENRLKDVHQNMHYVPWMVANLTVSKLEERNGAPLSWDNVIYGTDSLGYVEATHQLTQQYVPRRNLTYYLPLTDGSVSDARKRAQQTTYEQWVEKILNEVRRIHPNIDEVLEELNIQIWGHAMAQPTPGMIHGSIRQKLGASVDNQIHFAHTDVAGVSLFEEAFYQGLNAANKVKQNLTV